MMAVLLPRRPQHVVWDDPLDGLLIAAITLMGNVVEKYSSERKLKRWRRNINYSNVGLGSSLRGEPGLTTFRSQGCP